MIKNAFFPLTICILSLTLFLVCHILAWNIFYKAMVELVFLKK